jgi:DNA-directed RNA polymerase omega subunit
MNETHVPLEKLIKASYGSIYKLTILAAKRAMNIADGDKCLLDKPGEKVLDNSLKEIAEGKIRVKQTQ